MFWTTWIVSFTIVQSISNGFEQCIMWLVYYIITLPVFIIHTYLIAYWLVPRTFFNGQYWYLAGGILLFLVFFSFLELVISNELVFRRMDSGMQFKSDYFNLQNIIISGVGNHYIILVFLAIKAGRSWYSAQNLKEELLQTKMETDLEIYRYQLQPKLIYTLVDELEQLTGHESDRVPEMIVKISNFLNRLLYEGKEEMIPLELEAKLIEEYLDIHKHALAGRLTSNFIVNGLLKSYVVPPLLLLPFINSAIKLVYECNNSFESTVLIKAERKYILFTFTFWSEKEFRLKDDENINITKKRLNYSYPDKHRLIENVDENFREVSLEIFY